jgi:MscS family membrane protein
MTSVAIDNFGARRYRRYRTTLALTYDTPPAKLEAFCEGVRDVIRTLENMRKNGFIVEFESFGDSSLNVLLVCFVDTADPDVEMRTRTRLNLAILQLAERLGISFAFPTRTLHVEGAPAPLRPPPGP